MNQKRILIIGGTGTLGKAILEHALLIGITDITVLSRDEQKQQALKKKYPQIKFLIGDIKDKSSIKRAFENKDIVFHVAALKHIDVCEDNPIECLKTNTLGTINVAECCIENKVPQCMFSSTDKAVDPINSYGYSKAMSEKILNNFNLIQTETSFYNFRWGNVLNSNGSVIPYFINLLKHNKTIPITDRDMTRFFITIEESVQFIFGTLFLKKIPCEIEIPRTMKSASIMDIIAALLAIMNKDHIEIDIVGIRKGEKIHESLTSLHSEYHVNSKNCEKYSMEELVNLLTPIVRENS